MKKSVLATLAVSLLSISSIAIHADPIQVTVGGTTYDVAFSGGSVTCAAYAPYGGCDATSDFTYMNQADAGAALDQIVAHIIAFPGDYALLGSLAGAGAVVGVPYAGCCGGTGVQYLAARSGDAGVSWLPNEALLDPTDVSGVALVWASFIVSASVPEPGSLGLLSLGLAGLGFARRCRQAQT